MSTEVDDPYFHVLTPDECRERVREMLAWAGLTWEELVAQAERNDFETIRAKKAWVLIGSFGEYAT